MDALSSGGLHQAGKDTVGFQPAFGSGSEGYFAEDHQMPQRLFRKIIRGWHAGMPEESKEKLLLWKKGTLVQTQHGKSYCP